MQHDPNNKSPIVLDEIRTGLAIDAAQNTEQNFAKRAIVNRLNMTGNGQTVLDDVVRIQIKPDATPASEPQYASTATSQVARLAIPTSMLTRQESEAVQYSDLSVPSQQGQDTEQHITSHEYQQPAADVLNTPEPLNDNAINLADNSYSAAEHEAFVSAVAESNNAPKTTVQPQQGPAAVTAESPEINTDLHQEQVNAVVRARQAVWDATKNQPDQLIQQTRQQVFATHGSIDKSDFVSAA